MQLISCPWCGPREEPEFRHGGRARLAYPADPAALPDGQWAQYLFIRPNPRGPRAERWLHAAGCRRWFNVIRDTESHRVLAAYPIDEPGPELG
jgi:sarcosine oxidase, subunit delta